MKISVTRRRRACSRIHEPSGKTFTNKPSKGFDARTFMSQAERHEPSEAPSSQTQESFLGSPGKVFLFGSFVYKRFVNNMCECVYRAAPNKTLQDLCKMVVNSHISRKYHLPDVGFCMTSL